MDAIKKRISAMAERPGGWARVVALGVIIAIATGATGAVAANLITGKDIKNNTIPAKKLKQKVRDKLNTAGTPGQTGPTGPTGATGPAGEDGADGTASYANPEWGQIDRNTQGSPTVVLRGGPFVGAQTPPFGDGSLQLTVNGTPRVPSANDAEQATFGNEADFVGDNFNDVTDLGFQVYTTGENNAKGNPNMPTIKFEIDPNLDATPSNFSTLTYQPVNSAANSWSPYIDATTTGASPSGEGFFLSGAAGTATGCNLSNPCTFSAVQAALDDGSPDTTILSFGVGKGRDYAFSGAVDGLRLNDTIYDFEPFGVNEVPAP